MKNSKDHRYVPEGKSTHANAKPYKREKNQKHKLLNRDSYV